MKFLSILSFLSISFSAFAVRAKSQETVWWDEDSQTISYHRLLDKGADINSQNKYGETALMLAAEDGDIEMVQVLLKRGADMHIKDRNDETALNYAVNGYLDASKKENEEKHIKVINLLLSKTKNIDAIMEEITFDVNMYEEDTRRAKKVISLL